MSTPIQWLQSQASSLEMLPFPLSSQFFSPGFDNTLEAQAQHKKQRDISRFNHPLISSSTSFIHII